MKKIVKKLVLSKETVRNLEADTLQEVQGGAMDTNTQCKVSCLRGC